MQTLGCGLYGLKRGRKARQLHMVLALAFLAGVELRLEDFVLWLPTGPLASQTASDASVETGLHRFFQSSAPCTTM